MDNDFKKLLLKSKELKPNDLIISDLKWKYLIRSILKGKNIIMTGPSGSGKTLAAHAASKALDRQFFKFNLGASQDPRSMLIGNTHFDKNTGTYFSESSFIQAIKTKNAVILLDELSRAHPDAWNILMTVLDELQRYVSLDERESDRIVEVAEGVCFIATANIGNEYTATRTMDAALINRFVVIEMDVLNKKQEQKLLKLKFPNVDETVLTHITEITSHTRSAVLSDDNKISYSISTRQAVEMAELSLDGFSLSDIAEVSIYPHYPEGGVDSERSYMRKYIQKFSKTSDKTTPFNNIKQSTSTSDSPLPF